MLKRIFYGWWVVFACFLISLYVGTIIFYGFTAFIEPLVREFGWSYAQVSFAASLRGIEAGIFYPVAGFLVDRFGPRRVIFCGTIVAGIALILLSFTQSLVMFYGAFVLLAIGTSGCTDVVNMSAVANWFKKNVGKALGLMSTGFGVGGLLIPVIVWLIDSHGWRTTLILLGLGMWSLGVPLSLVVRNRPEEYGYLPDGKADNGTTPEVDSKEQEVEIGFRQAIKQKSFLYLTTSELIRLMTTTAVIVHVMPYLGSIGISRPIAGLVAAGVPLFSIIGRFVFGWLGDSIKKKYVMSMALFCVALGTVAFNYAQLSCFIYLFLLVFSSGLGGVNVLRGAMAREYFGRTSFGKITGIIMGFASIGGIVGPTLAGWIFDTFGNYQALWLVLSLLVAMAGFFILRIREDQS